MNVLLGVVVVVVVVALMECASLLRRENCSETARSTDVVDNSLGFGVLFEASRNRSRHCRHMDRDDLTLNISGPCVSEVNHSFIGAHGGSDEQLGMGEIVWWFALGRLDV